MLDELTSDEDSPEDPPEDPPRVTEPSEFSPRELLEELPTTVDLSDDALRMELPEALEASDEASELGPEPEAEEDFEEMEVAAECLDLDVELAKPLEDFASDGLGEGPAEPTE